MTCRIALLGALAFAAMVVLEHVLEPQLGPARHTISEYVNTDSGAVMIGAFLVWAASLLATAAVAWRQRGAGRRRPIAVLTALLTIASAAVVLTAAFATQTSAGMLAPGEQLTAAGRIHDLASAVAMATIAGAVLAGVAALPRRPALRRLALGVVATALVASVVLLSIGDPVDGIRQRLLLAAGLTWQVALVLTVCRAGRASRVSGT